MTTLDILQKIDKKVNAGLYITGGFVRDLFTGRKSSDIDIVATNIDLDAIAKLLTKYGKITKVHISGTKDIELVLFKAKGDEHEAQISLPKGGAKLNGHIDVILAIDALERDFTINAMYLPINNIDINNVMDYFGGIEDIKEKRIVAVKAPHATISASPIRVMRAIELASRFNFTIDPKFMKAAKSSNTTSHYLIKVPAENVQTELNKILLNANPAVYINMLNEVGILKDILPELHDCIGVTQNKKYHKHDVYSHCLLACNNVKADIVLRIAALLHDIGKVPTRVETKNNISFHKHELYSTRLAKTALRRLRYPSKIINQVLHLIENHMYHFTSTVYSCKECNWVSFEKKENKSLACCPNCGSELNVSVGWSDSAIRRFIRKVGLSDDYRGRVSEFPLFKLRIADRLGNGHKNIAVTSRQRAFEKRIEDILTNEDIITIKDLAINGDIIIDTFKLEPSPLVGKVLKYLLNIIIEDPERNTSEILLKEATSFLAKQKVNRK